MTKPARRAADGNAERYRTGRGWYTPRETSWGNSEKTERNAGIFEAHERGVGTKTLARRYGVSRERVRQVVDQERLKRLREAETRLVRNRSSEDTRGA